MRVDLALEVRSVLYRSHVIFYAEVDDGIAIVRVLHQSRDLEGEFSE
jgi:toxin ParE1/3/4